MNGPAVDDPVFILTLPRSWSSLVSAMVGQHPQLYGLPETHLLVAETVAGFWQSCRGESFDMADGILRAVAELGFRGQDDRTVDLARGWLRRRLPWSTGLVFEALAGWAYPRILVDKSPTMCYDPGYLQRAAEMFPRARYLHLVRHPRSYADSVLRAIAQAERDGAAPRWLRILASSPYTPKLDPWSDRAIRYDPQDGWLILNDRLRRFLEALPSDRSLQVHGEDVLSNPDDTLARIADWLGLRTDPAAIDDMKHPERSPYARYGPDGARFGNDLTFLDQPYFQPQNIAAATLDGPLAWRPDGAGFSALVRDLAVQFGYQ
jgi:hypothetical protein